MSKKRMIPILLFLAAILGVMVCSCAQRDATPTEAAQPAREESPPGRSGGSF